MSVNDAQIEAVLDFWFKECGPADWFGGNHLDATIEERFGDLVLSARRGDLEGWSNNADGSLALIILFDQFTRNIFRNSAESFAADSVGLEAAREAIDKGFDRDLTVDQRSFMYLPFEHSEDLADQARAVALFTDLGNANYLSYAVAHQVIIDRFGRFPHRNAVLGRINTPEEDEYLSDPKAGF